MSNTCNRIYRSVFGDAQGSCCCLFVWKSPLQAPKAPIQLFLIQYWQWSVWFFFCKLLHKCLKVTRLTSLFASFRTEVLRAFSWMWNSSAGGALLPNLALQSERLCRSQRGQSIRKTTLTEPNFIYSIHTLLQNFPNNSTELWISLWMRWSAPKRQMPPTNWGHILPLSPQTKLWAYS